MGQDQLIFLPWPRLTLDSFDSDILRYGVSSNVLDEMLNVFRVIGRIGLHFWKVCVKERLTL